MGKEILAICEVCGEETLCTEGRDGVTACSRTCHRIATGTDSKIPVDIMFRWSAQMFAD